MALLNSLSIKNYALIEDVELSLNEDLTIITGETGAGKSILLGALSLLLGNRADLKSLKDTAKKCVIEGVFEVSNYHLQPVFKNNALDYEPQTIIRREILPSGRSRAFVNDTPVKLNQLSALGQNLVDIHSQHETLFIGNADYQYHILDVLADNHKHLTSYRQSLKTYKSLRQELQKLLEQQREAQKTYDYHLFLLEELNEIELNPEMQEHLEQRFEELSNVEALKENLSSSLQQLQQEDMGIIDSLQTLRNRLQQIENYGHAYKDLSERMQSVLIEIEDISSEAERLFDNVEDNPEILEDINEKLQTLYKLQKKHNVATVSELIEIREELAQKIAQSDNAQKDTAALERKIDQAQKDAEKWGDELLNQRKNVAPKLTKRVAEILQKLGMPDARLKIELSRQNDFNNFGVDAMSWQFSANKGGRLKDMRDSASGGEFSRITLAVKSILAEYSQLPTIIFDEIDTGVSGEIAQKIGDILADMGQQMQVLAITHLPQIAAKGKHHFKVYKETRRNNTTTNIRLLDKLQRINELAEMLGGKEISQSAIAHAKVLLR